jgi:hypothetical protein
VACVEVVGEKEANVTACDVCFNVVQTRTYYDHLT